MNNNNNNNIHDKPADRNDLVPAKRGPESRKGERSKRLRVSRACDQCRAGREKCNGSQPVCQTCETQNRSCSYNEQPKKRGIQPHYIRTLELTLQWVLQQYPESERALSQRLPDSTDQAHRLVAYKDVSAADALHQDWRSGIICRQIDQLLSGTQIERPVICVASQSTEPAIPRINHSHPTVREERADDPREKESDPCSGSIRHVNSEQLLRLPENAWNLLEHYFAFTQTFLPITEKHDLLKLMYSYPAEGLHRSVVTAPEHAELWSIMAWCSSQKNGRVSQDYRDMARSLVPDDRICEISHAKALLVLGLIDMARSSWAAAWWAIGSAIRVLTHLIAGVPFELVSTAGRTRHTLLAAFLLESTVAAQTGAIAHLPPTMVQTLGLPIEDGIEEWSPWSDPTAGSSTTTHKTPARSISTFNELVRIALRFRSSDLADKTQFAVVLKLIHNASTGESRDNPSKLLEQFKASSEEGQRKAVPLTRQPTTPLSTHARSGPFPNRWHAAPQEAPHPTAPEQHHPYANIPSDAPESLAGSTPAQRTVSAPTPSLWPGSDALPAFPFDDTAGGIGVGADIFEELAMLDAAEENPRFMQNLGFGPDLDLAEFFGDDYQPTDTLHLQGI